MKAGARCVDMSPGPAGELAACRRFATDRLREFLEADAEHVVEEEGGAFQRRQALQRHHQRQRDVVDLVPRLLDDRLRQPGHDIKSEEHTSELQYLMRISYAVFCLTTNK